MENHLLIYLKNINKTTNENVTYIFLANKELREVKFKSIKEAEEIIKFKIIEYKKQLEIKVNNSTLKE